MASPDPASRSRASRSRASRSGASQSRASTLRTATAWFLAHGISRWAIHTGARRGDLIARLEVDPGLREDPFPAYDVLRQRGPMATGRVAWATTHHAVANAILRHEDFGVAGGHGELPGPLRRLYHRVEDEWSIGPIDPPSMLATDPPEHGRYRRLVSREFTPRVVARLEERVHEVAASLLDELEGRSSFDLVEDYAAQLPVAVIAEILGVPEESRQQILEWGNGAAITLDPGLSWKQYRSATKDIRALHHWFDDHVRKLRRDPGEDLLSRLALLEGEDALTDVELRATGLLVLGAGFETTVNLIGNAVQQLLAHPDQRAAIEGDPDLWGNAVEEVLRFDSPVQLTLRQAYADTEVAGMEVPRGQIVLCMLGGANRDPAVFEDPHTFDVRRSNAGEHLAFSSGVHYCLGANLARLEARIALQALYDRFGDLAADGPPVRRGTRVLRGYEHLPVRPAVRWPR